MDTLGIIRQLETDPGLRSQLRAVILGDEVLELPEVVRGLEARLETLTVRVEELAGRMETLAVRVEELAGRMETLATHMDALARAQARTEVRLDVLRGDAYERRVRENAAAILGTAAGGLRSIHVVPQGELADLLDEAVDAERLTGAERNDVLRADFVARALRRSDRQEVFVVAEASISPDANDADRAGRRAATVSRGLGRAAIPIVVATSGSQSRESWAVEVVRFDFPAVACPEHEARSPVTSSRAPVSEKGHAPKRRWPWIVSGLTLEAAAMTRVAAVVAQLVPGFPQGADRQGPEAVPKR